MIMATRQALGGVAHNIAQHANSSSFSPHMARALRAAGLETTVIELLDPTPYPSVTSEVEPLRLALAALHLKCVEILYKYEFSYLDVKSIKLNATVGKSGSSWRADVVIVAADGRRFNSG